MKISEVKKDGTVEVEFSIKLPTPLGGTELTGEVTDTPFVCDDHGIQEGTILFDGIDQPFCIECIKESIKEIGGSLE